MKTHKIRNSILLVICATIWGVAFVAQTVGMDYVGPFTFGFIRCFIGGIVLIPVIFLFPEKKSTMPDLSATQIAQLKRKNNRTLLIGGILCGIFLFIGTSLQQFGLLTTSAGKSGFITACYIILVPIIGLFFHKKTGPFIWIGVILALVGMYFLCVLPGVKDTSVSTGNQINLGFIRFTWGEILLFLCAIAFSFHILTVDHFSPLVNGIKLSCIQFFVCGILSGICTFIWENPSITDILNAWLPILYAGAMSCGIAYTLQIIGQKGLNPTLASLLMSLESVISVLAGWILLGQKLSIYEITGCILIFIAIMLAQLPQKEKAH